MASLYLVRHGQASFGADDYDQLSELGMRQCRLLGEWWRERGLDVGRVCRGPMHRHRQSLEAFADGLQRDVEGEVLDGIAEFDHENVLEVYRPEFADKAVLAHFLATTPRPRQAFHTIFTEAVNRWHDGRFDAHYRESWPVFKARVSAAFAALCEGRGDVMVFTSGGAISVMLQAVLGISDARCFALNAVILNGSVTRLLYRPGETSLHAFNLTPHLDIHNDAALLTYR